MIFIAPLQANTQLSNVRFEWIAGGVPSTIFSSGITQPSGAFPVFRIDANVPGNVEQLYVYDSTDIGNWVTVNPAYGLQE